MRTLSLRIPGKPNLFGRPDVNVKLSEQPDGTVLFEFSPRNKTFDDHFSVYFDTRTTGLASRLKIDGQKITATKFGEENVRSVGGADFFGKGIPVFDAAVKFGPPTLRFTNKLSFVLSTTDGSPIGLDELAQVDFGLRHSKITEKFFTKLPAAPNAEDDVASAFEDQPTTFDVLSNDTDLDLKDILRVVNFTKPQHGNISIAPNGSTVTYTPDLDYSGPDTFTYTVQDDGLPPGLTAKQIAALLAKKLYAVGSDTATVTVNVVAVADKPDIEIAAKAGATVNEILIDVSALTTDTDGSEYIDRLEFTGLAPGATIEGAVNGVLDFSGTSNDGITSTIKLILAPNTSFNFDLGIVAVAKEESNGDEETATATLRVEVEAKANSFNHEFQANDRSLWGDDPAFKFEKSEFIGLDETFDPPQLDFIIPPTPIVLFGDAFVSAKAGFQFDALINGGEVDAKLPVDFTLDTTYNKTTDQMMITPSAKIAASGASIDSTGPGGFISIDPIFDLRVALEAGLNLVIEELALIDFDERINPDLPGLRLDTGDAKTTIPLAPGWSLSLDFPELNADAGPSSVDPLVASDRSDNFIAINLDLDEFAANFFAPIGVLSIPKPWGIAVPLAFSASGDALLFDADVSGGLNIHQDLKLDFSTLAGKLYFEDGSSDSFNFAQPLTINNASRRDANHDGRIDFRLSLTPQATLENDTAIGINVNLSLDLFKITGTFSPVVGDDSPIDTALVDFNERFDITEIPVYNAPAFNLAFNSQDVFFFA